MRRSKYRRARERLRDLLQAKLQGDSEAKGGGPTPTHLLKTFADEAEALLDEFERLAEQHSDWRSIWQSFAGSWLYTASLGALALALYCSSLDFREMVKNYFAPSARAVQKALPMP